MPSQKLPKNAPTSFKTSQITDPRFTSFTTDPRFRLPSKKHTRTKLDSRFSKLLKDEDFTNTARVDRYGRRVRDEGRKKVLERLYLPDEEDSQGEDDEVVERELRRVDGYDPARQGGFTSSEEDEDDEGEEEEVVVEGQEVDFPDMQAEQANVEMGEVARRIAVVNMDWDNVRAVDLLAVFQSFVPAGGSIEGIKVFQSEFGKERMEREELEGPPREVFARIQDEGSSDEDVGSGEEAEEKIKKTLLKEDSAQEFDSTSLRQYQLSRLRYYYAVLTCSSKDTAQAIYESTDGTEYLTSANFFDLRFIPDDVEFDDKPRDECNSVPAGYKPTDFITHALQHSKVKLTWDMDPDEVTRKDAIKRAFTGSRKEIGENDLRAYLGSESDSSESDDEVGLEAAEKTEAPKPTKMELARQKMRAALGLSHESSTPKKNQGPVGDMQITFTAGLSAAPANGVFENQPPREETTAEKYIRKERERKARRKEKAKAVREARDPEDFPTIVAEEEEEEEEKKREKEDLGFNDPFFATDEKVQAQAAKKQRKEERRKKREAKAAEEEINATQRAELELLMHDAESVEKVGDFDIGAISKAEKAERKKKGKGKKGKKDRKGKEEGGAGLQEGFELDVGDERFGKLYQSHEFAIDPSHAKFRGTEGMRKLVEEGRRKRGGVGEVEGVEREEREGGKRRRVR